MLVLIGAVVVLVCVLGGFVLSHGQIMALWQPYELLIIGGGAVGAFLSANPPKVVKAALSDAIGLLKGPKYNKQDYVDLLSMLYDLFSLIRKEGLLGVEEHIEDPQSSMVFSAYPRLLREHHLIEFTTDCLRLMVGGSMNPHELEQLMDVELETHHHEAIVPALAMTKLADALPGFGIVAAVLGIVTTMSQLDGDTSRIGMHIAGALVGTFLGILLCYGFIGPLGAAMENRVQEDGKAFECVKIGLLANLRGYNPKVSVEFARKVLASQSRPRFQDLEEHLKAPRAKAAT
ncbi:MULTISPECIES: flagellar motor stator protein MotA [unclassified Dyella]|uniref:flagellar motor stator protein MotA n=1 Tax=unclassified Dyella TaxID=2634549 RepID=UPI000C81BEDF|nr:MULTISPECIES: flagellar motor stator protein MotA [unclassified Dyella]MDR3447685.1 flagellar motor stator protein MotA [Dyella sp.]PMQ05346.1 Motility protein A [Dyella sp. AD56]